MAVKTYTSGDLSTSNPYVQMRLQVVVESQSVEKNTSSLTVRLYARRTNTGYTTYGTGTATVTVGGSTLSAAITPSQKIVYSTGNGICLLEKTATVSHDTDGKKSLTVTGKIHIATVLQSENKSCTLSLPVIPRASSFTVAESECGAGQSITVSIQKQYTGFSHKLAFVLGDCKTSVTRAACAQKEETFLFSIPQEAILAIPGAARQSGTLTLTTYRGTETVGTASRTFPITVPEDIVPQIADYAVAGTGEKAGALLAGYAKAQIRAEIQPGQGAALKKVTVTGGGYTSTLRNDAGVLHETGVLKTEGEHTFTLTVTDSRGRTASESRNLTVLPYTVPVIQSLQAWRAAKNGEEWQADEAGSGLIILPKWSITQAGSNAAMVTVQYGIKNGEKQTYDGQAVSGGTTVLSESASPESAWEIVLQVSDTVGNSAEKKVTVPTRRFAWDVRREAAGIAFGKVSETDGCTDMTGYEKTYLGPQSFLGGEGSALEKKLYFVTPDGVTYPHKVRFYGGNGESQTAVGLYDDAIGESAVGIIWNYNDVLRTLNVKVPLVSNGGISVFGTGITLDQCAYTQLVIKKKSGQNGDAIQFTDCDSGKTNWRVNAYRDVSGTDDSSLRFQADSAGDGVFGSKLILYPEGLVSATGDFEAGGNTTLKGNATVNGWHYVKGQLRLDDQIRLYYNGASSLTGIIYQPNNYTINLGTYNGDDTLRYMQWLGEPTDLKRFVLRPSTNGGGYLGTTSMRWNTGFFTNTITQSDAKDKIHVQDLGQEALSFLSALRPVSFVFKDGEGGRTHLGLIAQEVTKAAAETGMGDLSLYQAVRLDEEGNEHPYSPQAPDEELRWGLNYQELIAPLIAAVQQLSRRVEELETQLSALSQQKEENG